MVACSKGDLPHESRTAIYNSIKSDKKFLYEVSSDRNHSNIYFDHPNGYAEKLAEFIGKEE